MATRNRLVFVPLLLAALAACSPAEELSSPLISRAQAREEPGPLHPPLAADAVEDTSFEYY